ncbi:MAG: glutamate synthase subunit beta [Actinobacteria bacterium]|nr:glutamate synthase subunit beta [Actinomycetota bacterium]
MFAIVGAGPAGYFAAQALQNAQSEDKTFAIDMIERLPTPWGLVRSGVAPDHPKIKTVSKVFEKIATAGNFRLFGNVELGTDVALSDLQAKYDAVIIATGSSLGRKLGIPGEELKGYLSAADFVPWYNAHPDYTGVEVSLDAETAIVIGAGNVAMDVARMLALDPSELDPTDTAEHAIAALKNSNIRKVYICARRGAEHAAFTSPELRELPKLEHTNVIISKSDIDAAIVAAGDSPEKDVKSNLDAMLAIAEHEKTEKVIKAGLVISAIGYEAAPLTGITYDKGKVLNTDGRVKENIYVVGWAKRGPSGVIGTNKSDAAAVIELLISDLKAPKNSGDINDLIGAHKVITQTHWEAINTAEVSSGEPLGKPRVKVADKIELLRLGGL